MKPKDIPEKYFEVCTDINAKPVKKRRIYRLTFKVYGSTQMNNHSSSPSKKRGKETPKC
jgi:hypothetical protein